MRARGWFPIVAVSLVLGSAKSHDVLDPFAFPGQNPIPVGAPGTLGTAWGELFADPLGVITVTSVLQTADETCTVGIPGDVQFAQARGYFAANGFVLANGYVDDIDDDGPAVGDPTACATGQGSIGTGSCTGIDSTLALALGTAYGTMPVPTADAAILRVEFTASAATTLDVSYEFITFESPVDPSFFDSFGVFFDGTLVAGGKSNMPPPAGTDPWTLTPSNAGEYQSVPASAFHIVPAHHTGLRSVTLAVPSGAHSLGFHVADGGPAQACPLAMTPGACDIVQGALFVGLHRYDAGMPGASGVCGNAQISRTGHPAPSAPAGAFPPDFQILLSGAPPGLPVCVALGSSPAASVFDPSCSILVDPMGTFFGAFSAGTTSPAGSASFPSPPKAIPPGVDGQVLWAQWWGLDAVGGTVFNTKGMRIPFGPP